MYDCCFRVHGLFDVAPGRHGYGATMIEDFLIKCLDILRGSEDKESTKKVCVSRPSPTLAACVHV